MTMRQYVVDAFTSSVFAGNPAAVCVLEEWPDEDLMRAVAVENNLSETSFAVPRHEAGSGGGQPAGEEGLWPPPDGGGTADPAGTAASVGAFPDADPAAAYDLRWFTPGGEIDMCGHATLATAFVVLEAALHDDAVPTPPAGEGAGAVVFHTLSGPLHVMRHDRGRGSVYEMVLPAYELVPVPVTEAMERAYGARPSEAWLGRDLVCVFDDEAQVRSLRPDQQALGGLDGLLQHATALTAEGVGEGREGARWSEDAQDGAAGGRGQAAVAGSGAWPSGSVPDCVSRSFAPLLGVAEDPVCGSGHCHIVPLWASRLGRRGLVAYQASARGGTLYCWYEPGAGTGAGQVHLAGGAVVYSVADLAVG